MLFICVLLCIYIYILIVFLFAPMIFNLIYGNAAKNIVNCMEGKAHSSNILSKSRVSFGASAIIGIEVASLAKSSGEQTPKICVFPVCTNVHFEIFVCSSFILAHKLPVISTFCISHSTNTV